MLRFGTIGTSWITEQFIEAAINSDRWQLTYVQSRTEDKARKITDKFNSGQPIISVEEMVIKEDIDAVYIASPNKLHFEYAKIAVEHGKHVIVEKPSFITLDEWQVIFDLATQKGVYVIEAARHIQTKNYQQLKNLISYKNNTKQYQFLGANLNIGQYSSKYDQYQASLSEGSNLPNIFNPAFSGGSLLDLGVYPIYVAVDLFGKPVKTHMHRVNGVNGIDLFDHLILEYPTFNIAIFVSKAVHSVLHSEFYYDNELVKVNNITDIDHIEVISKSDHKVLELSYPVKNPMDDEVKAFAKIIEGQDEEAYQALVQLSKNVLEVLIDLAEQ